MRSVLFLAVCILTGCSAEGTHVQGEAELTLEQRIVLAEPDSTPLTSVTEVEPDSHGDLLVIDGPSGAIRRYSAQSGDLLGTFGRTGGAPGEFVNPLAIAVTGAGYIWVGDQMPRLTRLTADLQLDTVVTVDSVLGVTQIDPIASGVILYGFRGRPSGELGNEFLVLDEDARVMGSLIPRSPLERVPYWGTYWRTHLVAMPGGEYVVVRSMAYPMERYRSTGELIETMGGPPPSYRPPSKPEAGAFLPPNQLEQASEWRESFTLIDGAWLFGPEGSKALAVVHSDLRQQGGEGERYYEYRLDVYRGGRKVVEDYRLPGPVVGAGDHLLVRLSEPPDGWGIGFFGLRMSAPPDIGPR